MGTKNKKQITSGGYLANHPLAGQKRREQLIGKTKKIMLELNVETERTLGLTVQNIIVEYLRKGESEAEIIYKMQRHRKVGEYRTLKVKEEQNGKRKNKELQKHSDKEPKLTPEETERAKTAPRKKTRAPVSDDYSLDGWEQAKRRMDIKMPKSLTFGAVGNKTVNPRLVDEFEPKPLAGINTPAEEIKTYDIPALNSLPIVPEREDLTSVIQKRIRPALRREFSIFVIKHRYSDKTADQLADDFLKDELENTEPKNIKDPVVVLKPNGEQEEFRSTHKAFTDLEIGEDRDARKFRLNVKAKGADIWTHDSKDYLVKLKYPRVGQLSNAQDAQDQPLKSKRKGFATVTTRPDQSQFSQWVEANCNGTCVITGARIHVRGSAAHLVEHACDGIDHYSNGLWLRWDIHKLFDEDYCAVDPETLKVWFLDEVIAEDEDLRIFNGRDLGSLKRPINRDFLIHRWQRFCTLRDLNKE
ncbi:HNH endonuclease [Buttiauxella gaviniae]|uniref:HNH endonuclease n=1 Tax=Enterobacterales TaxID=91347 RepID=UPI0039B0616C